MGDPYYAECPQCGKVVSQGELSYYGTCETCAKADACPHCGDTDCLNGECQG